MLLFHVPSKFVLAFSLSVSRTLSFPVDILSTRIQSLIRLFSVSWFCLSGISFLFTDFSQLINLLSHVLSAEILPEPDL